MKLERYNKHWLSLNAMEQQEAFKTYAERRLKDIAVVLPISFNDSSDENEFNLDSLKKGKKGVTYTAAEQLAAKILNLTPKQIRELGKANGK